MKCLSFAAAGELYAVDVTRVMRVVRSITVTTVAATPPVVIGLANLKGNIVTILDLANLLNYNKETSPGEYNPKEKTVNAVIFKPFTSGGDLMGLRIDSPGNLIDVDEDSIRALSGTTGSSEGFCVSGMAEAKGELYRIIDTESIISKFVGGIDENEMV